ncbi:MAG: hypothetical protein JXN64_13250 [Spirochaetes bacterium]|nr:hypothetical protein [Spirochaetota bacterium]
MDNFLKVSLNNISHGAAVERFDEALAEVIANIIDPNTEAKKTREIKLSVKILPADDERRMVYYSIHVDKKLMPPRDVGSVMYVGQKEGELVALESSNEQKDLPFETGEVVKLKEVENDR